MRSLVTRKTQNPGKPENKKNPQHFTRGEDAQVFLFNLLERVREIEESVPLTENVSNSNVMETIEVVS